MYFCIRRQIEYTNSDERLSKLQGVPIELALPQDLDAFLKDKARIPDIERQVRDYQVPVYSVNAPDGHLADGRFIDWAGKAVQFAEAVGAGIAVFHPEAAGPDSGDLDHLSVVENIKHLQERTQVVIAVETLWNSKRVLTPDQIMKESLPMVLDTSNLPKPEITWVIESYHTHIVNLHLSAVTRDRELKGIVKKFQPVERDNFCLDLLDRLQELEWHGVVTLEYMPWLHAKVLEDRKLLDRIYGIGGV
jgi:sugar phosphate isomerase/epimerase